MRFSGDKKGRRGDKNNQNNNQNFIDEIRRLIYVEELMTDG